MTERAYQILVVDDNKTSRLKMSMAIKQLGHETDTADDGLPALDKLKCHDFDLILLDIEMPGLDGYGVLEALKGDAKLRDIPVIVISAVDEMDNIVKAIELGAQDFLPKDFDPVLFRARVGACLEQKSLRDQEASYLAQIEAEKKRADDLLHATLPARAVEELKTSNEVKPRRFEDVVVLMADVVGFTAYCDAHPPEEAVKHLKSLVDNFENITLHHELEKIKTIGDAFMATADLLQPNSQPVIAAVRSALDMIQTVGRVTDGWEIRIGIHIGPVVAGVIGSHQHLFDIWGDTVNTTARITSMAEPNTVFASSAAWERLRGQGQGLLQGSLPAKGKGHLEVYQVSAIT